MHLARLTLGGLLQARCHCCCCCCCSALDSSRRRELSRQARWTTTERRWCVDQYTWGWCPRPHTHPPAAVRGRGSDSALFCSDLICAVPAWARFVLECPQQPLCAQRSEAVSVSPLTTPHRTTRRAELIRLTTAPRRAIRTTTRPPPPRRLCSLPTCYQSSKQSPSVALHRRAVNCPFSSALVVALAQKASVRSPRSSLALCVPS